MTKQFELCKFELLTSVMTEYYMGFKIVLNLILNRIFFYLNIEHLKFNTIVFFKAEFYRHAFSNIFFALNS